MPYESLVSTVELTGDVVDLGTYVKTGEEKTFPAGTSFDAVATDNESIVILKSSDGDYALFDISLEWPQTIEGKAAEECFESLFYAS